MKFDRSPTRLRGRNIALGRRVNRQSTHVLFLIANYQEDSASYRGHVNTILDKPVHYLAIKWKVYSA
jgi:hypothetical protein